MDTTNGRKKVLPASCSSTTGARAPSEVDDTSRALYDPLCAGDGFGDSKCVSVRAEFSLGAVKVRASNLPEIPLSLGRPQIARAQPYLRVICGGTAAGGGAAAGGGTAAGGGAAAVGAAAAVNLLIK